MITIIAVPKPFTKQFAHIQNNALASWQKICDDVILFGSDRGVKEAAQRFGFRHIPSVVKNEHGTPVISDIFAKAKKHAKYPVIAYVNSDVILFDDFVTAIQHIPFPQFLLIAKRRNILLDEFVVSRRNWQQRLKTTLAKQGKQRPIGNSSEFFVFPKKVSFDMPPFALGRLYWDSWLIYRARLLDISVIDGTADIFYLHQQHDYSHHKSGFDGVWYGDEARENFALAGGRKSRFKVDDADWQLVSGVVKKPPWSFRRSIRSLRVFGIVHPATNVLVFPVYLIFEILFKCSMAMRVFSRRGFASIVDVIRHPESLEYKLREL